MARDDGSARGRKSSGRTTTNTRVSNLAIAYDTISGQARHTLQEAVLKIEGLPYVTRQPPLRSFRSPDGDKARTGHTLQPGTNPGTRRELPIDGEFFGKENR